MKSKQDKRLLPQVEKMLSAASARQIERASEIGKRPRRYRRGRQTLVVLLASLALTGTALGTVTGWIPLTTDALTRASHHRCGSFHGVGENGAGAYRVTVSSSPSLRCETARGVIEAYWDPTQPDPGHEVIHHGGRFAYNSYYTIEGFPGFRCSESTDLGVCTLRDGELAQYEMKSVPAIVSPRGIGALRLGATVKALRHRFLIDRVGPGCEFHDELAANLLDPFSGLAVFGPPDRRLSTLAIRGGAETARHVGIGSTVGDARRAYPGAVYDPPGSFEPFAEGFIWVGGRAHPKMTFTIDPKSGAISEIDVPSPDFCE
jgi:hypothetical protein